MMDVDTMEAGRELDKLIAEKVLGLKVEAGYHGEQIIFVGKHKSVRLASYSTRIAAAWEIVETVQDDDPHEPEVFEFRGPFSNGAWHVRIVWRHHDGDIPMVDWFIADSLPLGICQAVLKRVGDD